MTTPVVTLSLERFSCCKLMLPLTGNPLKVTLGTSCKSQHKITKKINKQIKSLILEPETDALSWYTLTGAVILHSG